MVLSVLDKLLVGLIIVDTKPRIVCAYQAAKDSEADSGLYAITMKGKLHASSSDSNIELQAQLATTSDMASREGHSDGGSVILNNVSGSKSMLMEAVPMRDGGLPDGNDIQGSAVFVIDPKNGNYLSSANIAKIFGFTTSEEEVTSLLLSGLTVTDIADFRNSSPDTIRWHLKSIFSNSNTSSQLDLLQLGTKMKPPIK